MIQPQIAKRTVLPAIKSLSASDLDKYKRIIIIGDQGAGKTQLAGSAALDERITGVLYIDTEIRRGAETLYPVVRDYPHKILVSPVDDATADLHAAYQYMRMATNPRIVLEDGAFRPNLVVIDSITELADRLLNTISGNDTGVEQGELPKMVQLHQWGQVKGYIESLTRQWSKLPCHLIVTCREKEVTDDNQTVRKIIAQMPGKELTKNYLSLFGQVLFLRTEPGIGGAPPTRVLHCQEDALRDAKDCSHRLPPKIKNPTFTMLMDYFMKDRKD